MVLFSLWKIEVELGRFTDSLAKLQQQQKSSKTGEHLNHEITFF